MTTVNLLCGSDDSDNDVEAPLLSAEDDPPLVKG